MKKEAQTHFKTLLIDTRKSNEEAKQVLIDNGISLVKPTPMTKAELQNNYREMTAEKLINDAFSESIYIEAVKHLDNYHKELSVSKQ